MQEKPRFFFPFSLTLTRDGSRQVSNRKVQMLEDMFVVGFMGVLLGAAVVFALEPNIGWKNGLSRGWLGIVGTIVVSHTAYVVFEIYQITTGGRIRELNAAKRHAIVMEEMEISTETVLPIHDRLTRIENRLETLTENYIEHLEYHVQDK